MRTQTKRRPKKGVDYDGWCFRWTTWSDGSPAFVGDMAYRFKVKRADVMRGYNEKYKRWARRKGGRIVRVKLVEVPDILAPKEPTDG